MEDTAKKYSGRPTQEELDNNPLRNLLNRAPEISFPNHWKIQPQPAGADWFKDSIFEFSVMSEKSRNPDLRMSVFLRVSDKQTMYWVVRGGGLEGIGSFCNQYKNEDFYREVDNHGTSSLEVVFLLNEIDEMIESIEECFNNHPTQEEIDRAMWDEDNEHENDCYNIEEEDEEKLV